jgi:hypothetical protein
MAGALRIAEIPKECSGRDSLRRPLRGEQMSAYGTFETCRPAVMMSASEGRSEVSGALSNQRD